MNNFIIKDTFENISKTKKVKIKKWCKENLSSVNDLDDLKKGKILSIINNTIENKNKQYNKISLNYDEKTKLNILSFEKELSQRELFKKNLIEKQKNRGKTMSSNVDKRWELYEKIKSMPQMKNISNNIIDIALPNPDKIRENPELYKKNLPQIPNSILKDYFTLCLDF